SPRDGPLAERLHERLPLLAARGARAAPDRPHGIRRLLLPHRNAVRGEAPATPDGGSPHHLRRAPDRPVEAVLRRADRIADHAVAPLARLVAPLLTCATSS